MKPKIAIIFTPDGIDTIAILSNKGNARTIAVKFCSILENVFKKFEISIIERSNILVNEDDIKK